MKKFSVLTSELRVSALAVLAAAVVGLLAAGDASAMLTAKANHDRVTIDFFYHGSTVSVRGASDPGTDLIIKIASPEGHQVLKQKGKVGGTLWMNVGQLKFENTPNFYEVYSTKNLNDMLNKDERDKYVIGYDALRKHVEISPVTNEEEKATWFNEFVRFKEATKLYTTSAGKIAITANADGSQGYYILTDWPYQAAPGDYLVSVYAVKNGKIVEKAESKVKVEQVGMVKTLASLAKNNAAVYGFLSVGIALFAGFGVGMVFKKGGGSH
jgi:uncharacterized protein (TIGR02186 family)